MAVVLFIVCFGFGRDYDMSISWMYARYTAVEVTGLMLTMF